MHLLKPPALFYCSHLHPGIPIPDQKPAGLRSLMGTITAGGRRAQQRNSLLNKASLSCASCVMMENVFLSRPATRDRRVLSLPVSGESLVFSSSNGFSHPAGLTVHMSALGVCLHGAVPFAQCYCIVVDIFSRVNTQSDRHKTQHRHFEAGACRKRARPISLSCSADSRSSFPPLFLPPNLKLLSPQSLSLSSR